MAARRFLGLPFVTVSAHEWYIQESMSALQCETAYGLGPRPIGYRLSQRLELLRRNSCRKEMATKPGLTGNGRKNLFTANASEICEKCWHCRTKQHQRLEVPLEDPREKWL